MIIDGKVVGTKTFTEDQINEIAAGSSKLWADAKLAHRLWEEVEHLKKELDRERKRSAFYREKWTICEQRYIIRTYPTGSASRAYFTNEGKEKITHRAMEKVQNDIAGWEASQEVEGSEK